MSQSKDDFLKTEISYGVIVQADIPIIQEIKEFLDSHDGVKIIYQTTGAGDLWIIRKNREEGGR